MEPLNPQTLEVNRMYRVVPQGVQPDTPEFQIQQVIGRLVRRNGNTLAFAVGHQGQEREFDATQFDVYPMAAPLELEGVAQQLNFGNAETPPRRRPGQGGPPGGSPGQAHGGGKKSKSKSRKQQQKRKDRKTRQRRQRSNRTRRLH